MFCPQMVSVIPGIFIFFCYLQPAEGVLLSINCLCTMSLCVCSMTGAVIAELLKSLGYRMDDRGNVAQFWKGKDISRLQCIPIGSEVQPASHSMGSRNSFPGVKQLGH
jgi:hypothetical protein